MTRSVPEWIGATDDTPAPRRVRLRVFDRCGGVCHISGRKILPGDAWELDHVLALCTGGQNCESNLAPALTENHRAKTAEDVALKAKDRRIRKKHIGIEKKVLRPMPGSKASGWRKPLNGPATWVGPRK